MTLKAQKLLHIYPCPHVSQILTHPRPFPLLPLTSPCLSLHCRHPSTPTAANACCSCCPRRLNPDTAAAHALVVVIRHVPHVVVAVAALRPGTALYVPSSCTPAVVVASLETGNGVALPANSDHLVDKSSLGTSWTPSPTSVHRQG